MLGRLKNSKGLSFIDIIVALAITGTMVLFILPVAREMFTTLQYTNKKAIQNEALENIAEKVKGLNYDKIAPSGVVSYDSNYSYSLEVNEISSSSASLKNVIVTLYDNKTGQALETRQTYRMK